MNETDPPNNETDSAEIAKIQQEIDIKSKANESLIKNLENQKKKVNEIKEDIHASGVETWTATTSLISGGMILAFTLLIFALMAALIAKDKANPTTLMRTFTIPLVCVLAVILTLLGYGKDQIIPVIGLLGTVAGYLLGRGDAAPR